MVNRTRKALDGSHLVFRAPETVAWFAVIVLRPMLRTHNKTVDAIRGKINTDESDHYHYSPNTTLTWDSFHGIILKGCEWLTSLNRWGVIRRNMNSWKLPIYVEGSGVPIKSAYYQLRDRVSFSRCPLVTLSSWWSSRWSKYTAATWAALIQESEMFLLCARIALYWDPPIRFRNLDGRTRRLPALLSEISPHLDVW